VADGSRDSGWIIGQSLPICARLPKNGVLWVNLHIVLAGQMSNERRSSALRVAGSQHSIMFITTMSRYFGSRHYNHR
jgi:hypothetical protein